MVSFSDMMKGAYSNLKKVFGNPEKFGADGKWNRIETDGISIPNRIMDRVEKAYKSMETLRKNHLSAQRQFMGRMAAQYPGFKEVPVNLIRKMAVIYTRLLASGVPQVDISTEFESLMAFADNFEASLNRHLREIGLGGPMQGAVWSALFSVGCIKTGLAEGDEKDRFEFEGEIYDIGRAFSASIPVRNLVVDVQANNRFSIDFIGDRYLRPRYWIEEKRKDASKGGQGDLQGSHMLPTERASGVEEGPEQRLYDDVWVWDIYLPKQNIMCTYLDGSNKPIEAFEWEGPEGNCGPYRLIGFDWVDGEVLPVSPISALEPIHDIVNAAVRKLDRQAGRQKENYLFARHNTEDAEQIKNSNDGDWVGVTDPQSVAPAKFGGPDAGLHQYAIWAESVFEDHAGGLKVLAGTEPMSDTVGQDQLLHNSANAIINEMRREIRSAMKDVIYQHAWYVWTDPIRSYPGTKKLPKLDMGIPISIDPEVREGDFLQYNFNVRPYSLMDVTPSEEAAALQQFLMGVIMPNMQALMQMGKMPNIVEIIEKIRALSNVPIENLWVDLNMPMPESNGGSPEMIPWPQSFQRSERVNTRVNRSAPSSGAKRNEMIQAIGATAKANRLTG